MSKGLSGPKIIIKLLENLSDAGDAVFPSMKQSIKVMHLRMNSGK